MHLLSCNTASKLLLQPVLLPGCCGLSLVTPALCGLCCTQWGSSAAWSFGMEKICQQFMGLGGKSQSRQSGRSLLQTAKSRTKLLLKNWKKFPHHRPCFSCWVLNHFDICWNEHHAGCRQVCVIVPVTECLLHLQGQQLKAEGC